MMAWEAVVQKWVIGELLREHPAMKFRISQLPHYAFSVSVYKEPVHPDTKLWRAILSAQPERTVEQVVDALETLRAQLRDGINRIEAGIL